jgi:uncharacterized protein YkwD
MIRHAFRRFLRLETLEQRELLTAGGPSAEAQYMLELINQARTNPQAMAVSMTSNLTPDEIATCNYYGVDLNTVRSQIASSSARPPVAWNATLAGTATQQSQDQANTGIQTHTGANGSTLTQRLDQAGYTNRTASGEDAYAYSQSVDNAMEAFMIDWGVSDQGHRRNILQPTATPDQYYQAVGIGIVNTTRANFGPEVITVDFGAQANAKPYLLGVAYNDPNGTHQYNLGEGQGNVEIDATNLATGQTQSVQTWDAGGYQMQLNPGTYNVTARVGSQVIRSDKVSIGTQNVEVDYDLSDPGPSTASPVTPTPTVTSTPTVAVPQASTVASPVTALSNAPAVQTAQSTAPVQAQALTISAPSTPIRSGLAWLTNWNAWTARQSS